MGCKSATHNCVYTQLSYRGLYKWSFFFFFFFLFNFLTFYFFLLFYFFLFFSSFFYYSSANKGNHNIWYIHWINGRDYGIYTQCGIA